MVARGVWHRAGEGWSEAITEFHIVGGLHPELTLDWYCQMLRGLKERFPQVHLKALTMVEIGYLSQRAKLSERETLQRLKTRAWILFPAAERRSSQTAFGASSAITKSTGERWIDVARTAHQLGLQIQLHHAVWAHRNEEDRVDHL